MDVQYLNGQLYNVWQPSMASNINPAIFQGSGYGQVPGTVGTIGKPIGYGTQPAQQAPAAPPGNPFSMASSGGVSGTLQPYVNRMTQNANQALYGGLLGYSPQSIISGNAGGTPVNSKPPQWRLPSAIPTPNQGQVGLLGPQANPQQQSIFGNRSWMEA